MLIDADIGKRQRHIAGQVVSTGDVRKSRAFTVAGNLLLDTQSSEPIDSSHSEFHHCARAVSQWGRQSPTLEEERLPYGGSDKRANRLILRNPDPSQALATRSPRADDILAAERR